MFCSKSLRYNSVWNLRKNNLIQTLIHRVCWKEMIANKNKRKKKKKEAKSKAIWSSHISYCRLLILFSFIVVPNVFPSYWDGCYVCTLQREMIKEVFFFCLRNKALLFSYAALLGRSGNRHLNKCILCIARLKCTAAGLSLDQYAILSARENKNAEDTRLDFLKNPCLLKATMSWSFHLVLLLHVLAIWSSPEIALTMVLHPCFLYIQHTGLLHATHATYPYLKVPFCVKGVKNNS